MSRVEEMEKSIKEVYKMGGNGNLEWLLMLVNEIAFSLARIVDALESKSKNIGGEE